MDVDVDRWRALLDRERDLANSMPPFLSVQDAQTRLQVARSTLARFQANGPQGSVGGSPPRVARDGERILDGGMGCHGADDVRKAFDSSVRELEARVATAEHDSRQIELRRQQGSEKVANVRGSERACPQRAARIVQRARREVRMNATIQKLGAELARLQAEIVDVERASPSVAERFTMVAAELREAETVYLEHELNPHAPHPAQTAHLQRQALIGLCMSAGDADKILRIERQRIEQQGEGLSAADKSRRLAELSRAILRAAAQRELELRRIEGDDFAIRSVHPELAIYKQAAVERLAIAR